MKKNNLGQYSDANGNVYTVMEYVTQIKSNTLNSIESYDGFKSYQTSCGLDLNKRHSNFETLSKILLKPLNCES